jgi:hypothetical protein
MAAFHVDDRISLKLNLDLAVCLGEIILNARTNDPRLRAMGHELVGLDEDVAKKYGTIQENRVEDWSKWKKTSAHPSEWRQPLSSSDISAAASNVASAIENERQVMAAVNTAMHAKVASRKIRWGVQ